MNRALAAGASGMAAQQNVLDIIAANLSNVDTPGFRADRPEFASLIGPDGRGMGALSQHSVRLFSQGKLDATSNDFDLAIDGQGLFEVRSASGAVAYTRAGNFARDVAGMLRLPNNAALAHVRLPAGTLSVTFDQDGRIHARVAGKPAAVDAGRIGLCSFANLSALRLGDDGLFYASRDAGPVVRGAPDSGGFGKLRQHCLERANINVVNAMMSVLAAQRAYEANAKSVQAADEMLRLANNLERG
ncbi:MAG TPA: flagellar hook-basal body protein [Candidatus Eremiobacteraceae bacterium]|nr:flagellar hook-basal body protein [Candidatus Eremiobacteraceae bacterium]